jgi:hypothetical protein
MNDLTLSDAAESAYQHCMLRGTLVVVACISVRTLTMSQANRPFPGLIRGPPGPGRRPRAHESAPDGTTAGDRHMDIMPRSSSSSSSVSSSGRSPERASPKTGRWSAGATGRSGGGQRPDQPAAAVAVRSEAQLRRGRRPLPEDRRALTWCTHRRASVRPAAGRCARWARTSPRRWTTSPDSSPS